MDIQSVLGDILPGKIAYPGTELYEKSNGAYFTQFETAIKPAAIAQPTSVQEISALIQRLNPSLVKQEICLAIKGTGHTPFAGSTSFFVHHE
jgi:hypothetical protein